MAKHAKETSQGGRPLIVACTKALRAWLKYDQADDPAKKLKLLREARLLTGR